MPNAASAAWYAPAAFAAAVGSAASDAVAVSPAAHSDTSSRVVLWIALLLMAAKLGGHLAVRLKQPAVLGELVAGVVLGNLRYVGFGRLEAIKTDPFVDLLAQIGVLILLFEVGLESTVAQMMRVGVSALFVAFVGVAAPFGLGWLVGALVLPAEGTYVHVFLGATLSATSVGITARVLGDLGRLRSIEARIILGAAVIDDVLGLVVLAVVAAAIEAAGTATSFSPASMALILFKAAAFLVAALAAGIRVSPSLFTIASRLQSRGVLLATGLSFCFVLSWMASAIGLAPIVGAFAAGLILEDVHYRDFVARGEHGLEELVAPVSSFLVPIFFVLMGMKTDLLALFNPSVLGLAALLTVAAIAGKQICGVAVTERGVDRLSIGVGMVPRGEVGLIFASTGESLQWHGRPVISTSTFAAVVAMVVVTTMITPPALQWTLARRRGPARPSRP